MARSGSSSRFVSVNLNKSYGQPPSLSTGHVGSSASASPSAGLSRPRVPNSHVGMVLLSRSSGRSQPSVSSAASASSRASKLAVPRPVNLPSLRREHAGNDPTIALVGATGSSGWTKQQVSAFHGDSPVTQPGVPVDSAAVRSASMTIESSWGPPVSQGRVIPSLADVASMEQRLPSYQASTGRPAVYTPPGSRNASAINPVPVQYPPSEKAVIVRGEDFPTLQAAARPTTVPALHRQRDMQQKQRDKQHELKDQHMKLQQLSQQQNNTEDVLHLEHHSGPQLQPAQPVRLQVRSQQPSSVEGRSYETQGVPEKVGSHFFGPSPLIRLTHTSNWADDERETLQNVRPQRMAQSDRLDSGRQRNGYQFSDSWVLDHNGAADLGRPTSRNGSLSGFGRDPRDSRDYEKNGSLGFEGRVSKDGGFSNAIVKGFHGDQLEVGLRDDIGHWGRGVGRNDFPKRDWGSAAKEPNHNRDARLGNSSRSLSNRNNGIERDMNASTFRDADPTLRGDSLGRDMSTREVHSRDGSFRKDAFFSKHGLDDWQGDRPRKSAVGHQFGRSDFTSTGRTHAGARNDLSGLEYGREKRANVYGPDPFLEDPAFVGMSGLEAKISRRKKDELQNYRDPARELFEAELERVQKMQEQERQRMVEERERAIELARKEEEERERLFREEELLRLKIEEEAREAAAQAEREVEEAAKKAEELRRAREEEKRMVILEEERRKEAARKKLLELEERIAKRESTQQQRGYSVREASMGSFERARTEEMDVEDEDRLLPSFGKAEQNDERASLRLALPLQSPARREPVETPNSHPRLSGSALRWPPADTRGGEMASVERNRVVQMRRRDTLDDGPGLSLVSTQSHSRDDLPQLEHELEYRGFPFRDSNIGARRSSQSGASRSSSLTYTQERLQAERSTRKEQQWVSGQNEGFSGRHFSSDINAGYMDNGNERDADGLWGRDNRRRSQQEGQRLTSPPLPFYLNGGEGDYPSFGRLRQSLPKQPRVPPPILGRATLHRQTVHPEDTQAVPSTDRNDNSEGSHKDSPNSSSQGAAFEADIAEKVGIVDRPPSDAGHMLENLDSAASTEVSVLLNGKLQVFDDTVEDGSSNGSQTCHEQGSLLNEIDAVSELTECEERLEEDEIHTAVDMQETRTEESIGDDEDWLVQARAEEMGEEVRVHDCLHLQNEVAIDELEDQEWERTKVYQDEGDGQEHVNTTEVEEANWESQQMEEVGDGVVDDPDMPADSQWESDVYTPECEQRAETEVKDPALQDAVEDHVVQPLIQQHSLPSSNAFDSVQVGQTEGLSHGQSLLQQFQQPFSFMAVPLPQSTTSNSVLSSMHGFQTQQELPYHLQMGLLPGTPLMPNAIQIGSIQMPLHVHPQMPQLAHLHHQQPPVFQFGQICHSVPFSQPLPPMQPTVQIHHAIGQPLLPQHHQAESLIPVDSSHGFPKFDQVLKGVNEMAVQSFNGLSAGFNLSVDRAVEIDTILGSGLSSVEQKNDQSSVVVSAAESTNVQTPLPVVEIGSSLAGADENIEANQGTSAGRISAGRRRNNAPGSYGILGRGRGRLRSGKNHGFKGPYSVAETWPETGTREISRNRMFRRNFRRAEYKVRKPLAAFDGDPGVGMSQGKHLSSYAADLNASSRLESTERKPNEVAQEESRGYLYSRSLGGANTQNVEAVPGSHPMQAGSKSNQADGGQTDTVRNRLTSSSQTKGLLKKYKSDDAGDAPLQTGVVFVFEQPGIEIQNDKDDFIEVRSKRQMLREQRELRDKAKMKEFKVKEQVARKQQKLSVKAVQHEEAPVASSSKHGIERWSMSSAEMVNREGRRAKQSPSAAFGSALPQFSATSTSIGTSASESCDDSQKTSKVSKSGQGQSMSIATHIDSGKMLAYGHRYRSDAPDSTPNINAAWGVQRSSHEVVSLTQIQLEEAMKPLRFEGMPLQMAPISERGSTMLESGISLASGLALEKAPAPVKAPVSVPGPISSLLAGEKIQFGAVTSPTVISSGSHPTSPSFIGAIGSPLGFGADMANIPTHSLSHARNFLGPDSNGAFTSNKISTKGEDNVHGQLVDPEAEAEAAASAVAVAAISSDETVGNHSDASTALGGGAQVGSFSSFANSSGVEVTRPVIIQAPSISLGIDDSMVVALPADLSVETPAPLLQASLPSVPATSGLMLQSLPSRASPFPCLEMGTILGGPIFAFSPCEDAPLAPLEPGLAALGAGGVAGWQHMHSSTSDSFYGAPPPFMGPAGLPSIHGHPHMLVYTNPFTPVGQFGQLGVSFMGTAYHPSGKQPDWTHTPFTSSSGALNQNGGDMNAGLPGMMDPQHSGAPNSVQAISVAGCSMMPVAAPISLFDPNLSAPFQAQWSRAPAPPFPNYPLSGPAPGLNLQPRNSSAVPGDLGLLSQPMHISNGIHQLPETSSPFLSGDVAAARAVQFPDELGLGYSVISSNPLLNDAEGSSTRGHTSSSASAEVSGSKSHQGRRVSQSSRGNSNLATSSSRSEPFLGTQDARGNWLEASHLQTRSPDHQQRASGHHPNSPPFMDKRASQQAPTRGSLGADWAGSNQRKGSSRTVTVDRVSVGERGSASSSKLKQIYVAKPAAPTRNLDPA